MSKDDQTNAYINIPNNYKDDGQKTYHPKINETNKLIRLINDSIVDYRYHTKDKDTDADADVDANQNKNLSHKDSRHMIHDDRDNHNVSMNSKDSHNHNMEDIHDIFGLRNKVVAFFNGREWCVILFDFMLEHPILIYKHWSEKDQVYYDNSLFVCPITLRSMIYKGKVKVLDIKGYEIILLNEDTGDSFPISNPYTGHLDKEGNEKKIKSHVKRHEVKILEHRDIFAFESDPKYIIISKNKNNKKIIDMLHDTSKMDTDKDKDTDSNYYTNRVGFYGEILITSFHPKTLVYVVQYYSKTDKTYRHLLLIGSTIDENTVSGYKYKLSKVWKYTEENKETLIEKRAFIYPMLWYTVEKIELSNYDTHIL